MASKMAPGTGIALGVAVGVALGVAFDDIAMGLAIGTAVGAGIDAMNHAHASATKGKADPTPDDETPPEKQS